MTVLDNVFNFSDEQDVASGTLSSGTTIASTNVIDSGSDMKDAFGTAIYDARLGSQAKKPVVVVTVGGETFAGGSTLVKIQSKAASASISSGGTEHARTTIPASAVQGTQYTLPVPVSGMNRYWGLTYTASGGAVTAGYANAYLADAAELHD